MELNGHGRLLPRDVERLHRVLGGDRVAEEAVLRFIAARYGARSLVFLPANVGAAILKRPSDFLRAAKMHWQPELRF
jgi:hypothetical protein